MKMKRQINDLKRELAYWQKSANAFQRDAEQILLRAREAAAEVEQYERAIALLEAQQ